jgi:hypothetical protein
LFIVWASFRYFIHLPSVIEELWFKPIIWLTPLFWWNLSLKKRMVVFNNNWLETITWGVGIAMFYWILITKMNFNIPIIGWDVMGVAMATAITEELVFSGFIMGYLERYAKGSFFNAILTGLMAAVMRLPILLFVYKLSPGATLGVLLLAAASTMINSWIRQRTGNVTGSIIARVGLNLALLG